MGAGVLEIELYTVAIVPIVATAAEASGIRSNASLYEGLITDTTEALLNLILINILNWVSVKIVEVFSF